MKEFRFSVIFIALLMLALGFYYITFSAIPETKLVAVFPLAISCFMFSLVYMFRNEFKTDRR